MLRLTELIEKEKKQGRTLSAMDKWKVVQTNLKIIKDFPFDYPLLQR